MRRYAAVTDAILLAAAESACLTFTATPFATVGRPVTFRTVRVDDGAKSLDPLRFVE